RNLAFHHFGPHTLPNHFFPVLDLADAAHIDTAGGEELQCSPARRRFRAAEHDADLLANLVDEDHAAFALGDHAGELPQSLAHQAGLQADEGIAHFALQFLLRNE